MKIISEKIKRPNGTPVYLTIRAPVNHLGLAFVQPGNGGKTSAAHNQAIVDAYLSARYVTVSIDEVDLLDARATLSELQFGADDEEQKEATAFANAHTASMAAAVNHVVSRFDYRGRIALAGHSAGARSALLLATQLGADKVEHVTACAPWWLDAFIGAAKSIQTRVNVAVGELDEISRPGAKSLHKRLAPDAQGAFEVIPSTDHQFSGAEDKLREFVSEAIGQHPDSERVSIPEDDG